MRVAKSPAFQPAAPQNSTNTAKRVSTSLRTASVTVERTGTRTIERDFAATAVRAGLERTMRLRETPTQNAGRPVSLSGALTEIDNLPVPSLNDRDARLEYQRQRAEIANEALANATPPRREDFSSLPPRLAAMEYQDSLNYYNTASGALQEISDAAAADLASGDAAVIDEAAERVWDAAENDPHEGARTLAHELEELTAKYGPEAAKQLMDKLIADWKADPHDNNLPNILTHAGGAEGQGGFGPIGLSPAERDIIGQALGQSYDAMSAENQKAFVDALVMQIEGDAFRGNFIGGDPTRIADLIARSGSAELKSDMVDGLTKRMAEINPRMFGNNGGVDVLALANSAAMIAESGATSAERVAMFNSIISKFPGMDAEQLGELMDNPQFKDSLSRIFLRDAEAIIKSLTNDAGGLISANATDSLRIFFEMTMFASNPGELRDSVMAKGIEVISRFADPQATATSGRSKTDDARTAGSLIALVQAAAINQYDSIKGDQAARLATTQMFVGLAFSFVPGSSKVLGEGADKSLTFIYDKAVDYAKSNAGSGLGRLINNLVDGDALNDIKEGFTAIRDLRFAIEESLDDESQGDILEAFSNGYAVIGVDQLFARLLK